MEKQRQVNAAAYTAAVTQQRNQALDTIAMLEGHIAYLNELLAEKEKPKSDEK